MKRVTIAMVGLSLVLALSAFLLTPQAEAVSALQMGNACSTSGNGTISFFMGEDGAIWYTVTRVGGVAPGTMTTGNSKNPFDQGVSTGAPSGCVGTSTCNGFVSVPGLTGACAATSDTCNGIYAKTPGPGTFADAPTVQNNTPISTGNCNVIATGGDKNFYYTQFDNGNTGGPATMGSGNPGKDPFSAAKESGNSAGSGDGNGFADQTSLSGQCTSLSRTCVGIWVRFP